jgi:hypothetical protein
MNVSMNRLASGASGACLESRGWATVGRCTFFNGTGDVLLNVTASGGLSDCNFIGNKNRRGSIVVSVGSWVIRRSIFLRNDGEVFESVRGPIFVSECFTDGVRIDTRGSVSVRRVVHGNSTATHRIVDWLRGQCPGSGTQIAPVRSVPQTDSAPGTRAVREGAIETPFLGYGMFALACLMSGIIAFSFFCRPQMTVRGQADLPARDILPSQGEAAPILSLDDEADGLAAPSE